MSMDLVDFTTNKHSAYNALRFLLIAIQFFADGALPFRDIRQGSIVKDICDCITHIAHNKSQATDFFIRAAAGFIRHLTHTLDGGDRAIQDAEDLPECDLAGGSGKIIAAADTHLAVQQSGVLECKQDLFEEFGGDLLALRDFLDLHHNGGITLEGRFRQGDHCP